VRKGRVGKLGQNLKRKDGCRASGSPERRIFYRNERDLPYESNKGRVSREGERGEEKGGEKGGRREKRGGGR